MSSLFAKGLCLALVLLSLSLSEGQEYPKLYEYFTEGGINSGLEARDSSFWLNGKYLKIISGTIHHYRVHPNQLRNSFRKLRALGCNAVETYNAWNLHEPRKGEFDFGNGGNDFSEFANITRYVQIAQEEDLLVILRPGPFINSEWDFGAMPSWLLRDPDMKVREYYQPYLDRVKIYLDALLKEIFDLQFTKGGPIIALQIENEYTNFEPRSREYLEFIQQAYIDAGFNSTLFFTADNGGWINHDGGIPGVLQTANAHDVDNAFTQMLQVAPDMPLMVTEFYPGWLNHWFETWKGSRDHDDYLSNMEKALNKYNGSINIYPFHGGSSFGFMTGSNTKGEAPYISPVIQSYDFDAVLTENGDYSVLYDMSAAVIDKYENPKLWRPERPAERRKTKYDTIQLEAYLSYNDMIDQIPSTHKIKTDKVVAMEELAINDDNGQSYGFVIYRTTGPFGSNDRFTVTHPKDFAQLIIDGEQINTGFMKQDPDPADYWINDVKEFPLTLSSGDEHTVDVMIENLGRTSHGTAGDFRMNKGLPSNRDSKLELNDIEVKEVEIISVEFKNSWAKNLTNWRSTVPANLPTPCLVRATFYIPLTPVDTFLDMREWHKGVVFINGFNLGRYWKVGPQRTIYIPAELLNSGENNIIIFEQLEAGTEIAFLDMPILGTPNNNRNEL